MFFRNKIPISLQQAVQPRKRQLEARNQMATEARCSALRCCSRGACARAQHSLSATPGYRLLTASELTGLEMTAFEMTGLGQGLVTFWNFTVVCICVFTKCIRTRETLPTRWVRTVSLAGWVGILPLARCGTETLAR